MGRTARKKEPPVKPVQKIQLSEKNSQWRFVAFLIVVMIAVFAFGYGLTMLLNGEPGWREIEVPSSAEVNCSEDFIFQYYVGGSGASASADQRMVTSLYRDACVKAYQLFTIDAEFENINNMYYLNRHPNEVVEVDSVLYQALEKAMSYNNRNLFLAPVYEQYENLFYCNDDVETINYDPYQNDEIKAEFTRIAELISDKGMIDLQLLGDDQVMLYIADEYMQYANEVMITNYIDFNWMRNAFIIDYLADTMIEHQYTLGSISSCDGFVRNLDDSETGYSFNLYDRQGQTVYPAAVMQYNGAKSIVYLKNYPMTSLDAQWYYEMNNGEIRTMHLDVADGLCKSAVNNLVSYSDTAECADLLLQMIPVYISNQWEADKLSGWKEEGIFYVYFEDGVLYSNDNELVLDELYDKDGVQYTVAAVSK